MCVRACRSSMIVLSLFHDDSDISIYVGITFTIFRKQRFNLFCIALANVPPLGDNDITNWKHGVDVKEKWTRILRKNASETSIQNGWYRFLWRIECKFRTQNYCDRFSSVLSVTNYELLMYILCVFKWITQTRFGQHKALNYIGYSWTLRYVCSVCAQQANLFWFM